ncbi:MULTISPECIES: septum site-determining protein MinC [unclassified Moraxella]|uniref:septum site-determining protein MinC n=1 Tax=unclassified Moraxella TaxID=2685852 RepID=UPI003AF5A41B
MSTTVTATESTINNNSKDNSKNNSEKNAITDTQPLAVTDKTSDTLPVKIKLTGRMLSFSRLNIEGDDIEKIRDKLTQKLGKQHQTNLPVLVSCQHSLELKKLWEMLWQLGLQPIGIITGLLDEQAKNLKIAIFPADGERIDGKHKTKAKQPTESTQTLTATLAQPTTAPNPATTSDTDSTPFEPTNTSLTDGDNFLQIPNHYGSHVDGDLVCQYMLRSGQSINHVGGDVILTQGINAGAEAITDYSLHVYGKAEGRLVAGATGDKNAKIFCLRFNPSLVSVAGTYCLKENIPSECINQAVQVSYQDGKGLVFSLMNN